MTASIATPHHLATEAGAEILRAGGSAIDAAIAAAAMTCVVYPHNVALGSDLVALIRNPAGRMTCVNATGWAGSRTDVPALRGRFGDRMPVRGGATITVPGAIAGWKRLRALGGRLPLATLLAPAAHRAERGFRVGRSLAAASTRNADDLAADPGCAARFLPGGRPLTTSDHLVQARLAHSLRIVMREGEDAFYDGDLARRWLEAVRHHGASLDPADLTEFRPQTTAPVTAEAFGHRVWTSPPNTQGFSLLRTLSRLGRHPGIHPSATQLVEAFRDADAARDAWLSDPRFSDVGIERLLDHRVTPPSTEAQRNEEGEGDTVGISVIDHDGTAVSLIQSVFHAFGSCVLDPDTGILFHNRGTSFSLRERDVHVYGPGRRPPHTLMPVIAERAGDSAVIVSSTKGGRGQPQIHAQILLALAAGSTTIEAVAAPRFIVTAAGADRATRVSAETDLAAEVSAELAESFDLEPIAPLNEVTGHANVITALPNGHMEAASDPRSDGSAIIVP